MMIRTEERIAFFVKAGVRFLKTMPEGWHEVKDALTAPAGYIWIRHWNEREQKMERALLKQ